MQYCLGDCCFMIWKTVSNLALIRKSNYFVKLFLNQKSTLERLLGQRDEHKFCSCFTLFLDIEHAFVTTISIAREWDSRWAFPAVCKLIETSLMNRIATFGETIMKTALRRAISERRVLLELWTVLLQDLLKKLPAEDDPQNSRILVQRWKIRLQLTQRRQCCSNYSKKCVSLHRANSFTCRWRRPSFDRKPSI